MYWKTYKIGSEYEMCKCKLCGEPINETNTSSEHIIHQALGGLLETEDILCISCNSKMGSNIDSKFVNIFAPITGNFNIKTSSGKPPKSKYWAYAKDNHGIQYKVEMYGKNIRNVFDMEGKYVNRLENMEPMKVHTLEFNIKDNNDFVMGLKKLLLIMLYTVD